MRDVVAIGASAGGVEALQHLCAQLPADLPATVLIVQHVRPTARSRLAEILDGAGPLQVMSAREGAPMMHGRAYVAVPGRHLQVHGDHLALGDGPIERFVRPSIDVLFRSVARHCGARAIGVVLTGLLSDGAAGLAAIVAAGGMAVVQQPDDAAYPAMPRHALERTTDAHVVPLRSMAQRICRLLG
jgi:two-component system, chemotaxis family, protein-glutamate methylesterase/glutaminase